MLLIFQPLYFCRASWWWASSCGWLPSGTCSSARGRAAPSSAPRSARPGRWPPPRAARPRRLRRARRGDVIVTLLHGDVMSRSSGSGRERSVQNADAPRALHARSFKLRFAAQREVGRSYVSLVKPLGLRMSLWMDWTLSCWSPEVMMLFVYSGNGDGQVLQQAAGRRAAGGERPQPHRQHVRAGAAG